MPSFSHGNQMLQAKSEVSRRRIDGHRIYDVIMKHRVTQFIPILMNGENRAGGTPTPKQLSVRG
jgi:hypothetical protein